MTGFDKRLDWAWWALRIGLGVGPIITGLDKFFNKLADWGMYLSPLATKIVPVSATTFMHVVGVVEIVAGLIVLSRWTKIGSYIVMLWLLGIAVNLLTTGMFYDLAMRDVGDCYWSVCAVAALDSARGEAGNELAGNLVVDGCTKLKWRNRDAKTCFPFSDVRNMRSAIVCSGGNL